MYQPYDVQYHEDVFRKELRLWCLNEKSDPVLFRVTNLNMYTTHILPENVNWSVLSLRKSMIKSVSNRLRSKDINFDSVNICMTKKLCYHDPRKANGTIADVSFAVVVNTKSKQDLQRIENVLRYPTTISYGRTSVKIKTSKCDPRIQLDWKILCNIGMSYCGWFKVNQTIAAQNPISTIPEYITYPENIIPAESTLVTTPVTMSFDIECFSDNPKAFPKEYKPKDIAYLITTSTKRIGTSEKTRKVAILLGDCDVECDQQTTIIKVSSEEDLVRKFEDVIRAENPIMITGYNSTGFDWKYLDARMALHNIEWSNFSLMKTYDVNMASVSWGSSAYGDVNLIFPDCPGRIFVDVMSHVKRNYKLQRYTLNRVAEKFLGKTKLDVSPQEMFAAFRAQRDGDEGHIQKMSRVVKYGIIDADLPIELFEYFKMWVANNEMCNVVNVTPNMLLKTGQQKRVAALLYNECKQQGITMNYQVVGAMGYTGGYVAPPIKGMHEKVITLDFAALYPSIMFMWNLCYSTYVPPEFVKFIKPEHRKYYHFITIEKLDGEEDSKDDEGKQSETYVFFRGKMGIIPKIVRRLLTARKEVKKQMKQHPKGSDQYNILDARQLAYKVSCNSIYGFLGVSEQKGILPLSPISKTVTFLGRDAILKTNKYIMDKWPGTQIIYNDTDSTMYTVDKSVPGAPQFDSYEKFGEMVGQEVSRYLREHYLGKEEASRREGDLGMLDLEFEKVVDIMFNVGKKMYVMAFASKKDPTKIDYDGMIFKGITLARRTACNYTRNMYRTILIMIMNKETSSEVMSKMVEYMILCRSRSIKMCDLLENQGVGGSYANKTYPMALFIDQLALDGKNVKGGERLDYIVLKSVDGKRIARENGKEYKGDKMRLMEQVDDLLKDDIPFKIDTSYYSEAGIDNIDRLFSIVYHREIDEKKRIAKERCLKLHEGNEKRIRILSEANYPDFRIRNSSYFTRVNATPLRNLNKLAELKTKILDELVRYDCRYMRRVRPYINYRVVVWSNTERTTSTEQTNSTDGYILV